MGDYEDQPMFDIDEVPDAKKQKIAELAAFLERVNDLDQNETLRKASTYSQIDLEIVGETMARVMGIPLPDLRTKLQLGIGFYALGKVARLLGALGEGRQPSADTWWDLRVYGTMGLRVHEEGKWV